MNNYIIAELMPLKEYLNGREFFSTLTPTVECQNIPECEYCRDGEWFTCDCCNRTVPWCFGGDDHGEDELCNDCWAEAEKVGYLKGQVAA